MQLIDEVKARPHRYTMTMAQLVESLGEIYFGHQAG